MAELTFVVALSRISSDTRAAAALDFASTTSPDVTLYIGTIVVIVIECTTFEGEATRCA